MFLCTSGAGLLVRGYNLPGFRCRLWIPSVRARGSECNLRLSGAGFWLSERKVFDSRSSRFFSFLWFFLFFSPKKRKERTSPRWETMVLRYTVREPFLAQISMFFTPFISRPFSRVCPDLLGLWLRSRFWCLCWFGFFRCCGFCDSLHCGWRAADQRCNFADGFPFAM